jgi:D-glycero-D-manno-heptose 1,7-bisphosphate phosphatase
MLSNIDKSWALFLDRDGVINQKIDDDYVKEYDNFVFMPQVKEILKPLHKLFGWTFIATNQQGIGKGLMTENDLLRLHWQMQTDLYIAQIALTKIYHCPDLASKNSPNRKPEIGMALQAKNDFPAMELAKAVMIGDSMSDMEFGKKAGMKTIFFGSKTVNNTDFIDFYAKDWTEVGALFGIYL